MEAVKKEKNKSKSKNKKKLLLIFLICFFVVGIGTLILIDGCSLKNPNDKLNTQNMVDEVLYREEGKSIEDYSAKEVIYIVNTQFKDYHTFSSSFSGNVKAGSAYNQKMTCRRFKVDDELLQETISTSSLVKIGNQDFFKGDTVISRKASKITSSSTTWNSKYTVDNLEGYAKKYGSIPTSFTHFVLNDDSIDKASLKSSNEKEYVFEYVLNNKVATPKYQIKMKTNGTLADYPKFSKVVITLTVDKDFKPIKMNFLEKYTMNKKIIESNLKLKCESEATETFAFDGEVTIPNIDYFHNALKATI